MGISTSVVSGIVATGEGSSLLLPRIWRGDGTKPGIIQIHGYGGDHTECVTPSPQAWDSPHRALAAAGYPVVGCDYGGVSNWGNDTCIGIISKATAYLQSIGARPGKVVLIGTSMGFLGACNWARQNLSSVLGLVGLVPACDLGLCYTTLGGGQYTASINAAYGGPSGYSAAQPTHDPQLYKASLTGLNIRGHYSTDDTVQSPSNQAAWLASVGATVETQTGGHSLADLDIPSLVSWIKALG